MPSIFGVDSTSAPSSPDLWAEITTLTDFAEVDLDDPLINLSRSPLFLTEERPFSCRGQHLRIRPRG